MEDDDDTPDTRIFVSGLPPKLTSNQLGAHFAGRYQITDAVVIPDRRIGFVGFRNYTLAKSAIKYFDKTYLRMSKISVQMAKAVEIERTSNLQGFPKSNHSHDDRVREWMDSDSALSNDPITSDMKSNNDSTFQAYTPSLGPQKRKRESVSKQSDEYPKSVPDFASAVAGPSHEKDIRRTSTDDQNDRDLKRARRKEKKKRQEHKTDVDDLHEVDNRHKQDTPTVWEAVRSTRKAKVEGIEPEKTNIALATLLEVDKSLDTEEKDFGKEKEKKEKKKTKRKKNKDSLTIEQIGNVDKEATTTASGDEQLRKTPDRKLQVDDDTKGGVEPIDGVAFVHPEQSADQNKQQRRRNDITSDHEWLRTKTNRILDLMDETLPTAKSPDREPKSEGQSNGIARSQGAEHSAVDDLSTKSSSAPVANGLPSNGRLFVRNLPYTVDESDIEGLFSKYGHLDEVHLARDKSGNSKGIGYIQFSDKSLAKHAVEQLDGKPFQGRLLHILPAAERNSSRLDEYEISKLPVKKQKALKRKMEAARSTFNWNSMYMNPNAVLSSVADRLGVEKADLIDVSSSDAAVKQAHAETHVIQETKAFFTLNGVNLDAFRQREKDESTLLVKNFPFGTTAEELKTLFGPYGEIVKFLLPPSGTTAIIQYARPGDGSQAMRHLAYRNLKGSVLYLEKAPKKLFDAKIQSVADNKSAENAAPAGKEALVSGTSEEPSSSTLFVRNLDFATTTSGLIDAFKPLSGFLTARVKTKIDPKRPQELLSMGFGFVEFSSNHHARAALAAMDGHRLDKHELLIQLSRKATDAAGEQRHKDNSRKTEANKTKIIIKNLPFEATKKDVRALLSAYGQLRSVKVPQKFDRSTRGFAFADFVTAKEAENAMEALKDTHLLGRRLVLEFAEEESIDPEDEIRAIENKVGRQTDLVHLNKMTGSSRRKFILGAQDDVQ